MNLQKIKNQFDKLDEKGQWAWLVETKIKDKFTLYLDNDDTHIYFHEDEEAEYVLRFKDFIGNSSGVDHLLLAIGVKCEGV